jgi:hypothetical protein
LGDNILKAISELTSKTNRPRLIPSFKQTERKLLSIFMAVLEIVPELRGGFLELCGYRSGKTCSYQSFMEPEYSSAKIPDFRPDGLIVCTRGATNWTAFIEAKAEKKKIRPEQIQNYAELANQLSVENIITISNEFAREPQELPYSLASSKRKRRNVYHFAWAEIRTFLELFRDDNKKLSPAESAIIQHCLEYMWEKLSGVLTFDAMPQDWPKFVESSGTALGFSTQTAGVTEIVHGWQQERRDLGAKLIHKTRKSIELRHGAGARADQEQRLKFDRKELAEGYKLSTAYMFKKSRARLRILADLRSCKISAAIEFLPPSDKKAKACVTWIASALRESSLGDAKISFDWKGRGPDSIGTVLELLTQPESSYEGQKDSPKKIRIIRECQDVRRFKSKTRFIEDLEKLALGIVADVDAAGLL